MTFKLLFPSVVYEKDSHNLVNEDLINLSKDICINHGKNIFVTKCLTTVESGEYGNILEMKEFSQIKSFIVENVFAYIDFLKFNTEQNYRFTSSWLNYYAPGDFQEIHIHHNNMISGCFYLLANNQDDFYFRSHLFHQQPVLPYNSIDNEYNQYTEFIKTYPGKLLLFMSGNLHGTLPSKCERISLSFNITF